VRAQGIATVARQEFQLRIRAGRWKLLLALWFVVLLGFTALLRGALGGYSDQELSDKGVVVFGGLMLFVLGLALLVVPALAAQSVNGDRERGTLATLQVTRLSAGEIALGKFAAAWGTALVFVALTLPLVAYAVTQKGVPVTRVLVVLAVLALLLGTVCAVSLALSALLRRTTTSGVLAYLAVFALTLGTLVVFGLVTAVTVEHYQETAVNDCPPPEALPSGPSDPGAQALQESCSAGPQTFDAARPRTDRTWFLLAPNPFVVLADAAPQLPPETAQARERRLAAEMEGGSVQSARDIDPLGAIGRSVRGLRRPPPRDENSDVTLADVEESRRVWPYGLAADVALAGGALLLTARALRTPSRRLPRGQRVA